LQNEINKVLSLGVESSRIIFATSNDDYNNTLKLEEPVCYHAV